MADAGPGGAGIDVRERLRAIVRGVVEGSASHGCCVVLDGPAGIGKSHLVGEVLAAVPPDQANVLSAAGDPRLRSEPFATVRQLTGVGGDGDPTDAVFDHVDQLCGTRPTVLWVDNADQVDAASLAVLRRLAWATRDLALALVVTARPAPRSEPLSVLVHQADEHLRLPPMTAIMIDRLVFDRTGCWPGPRLREALRTAAGNPLFATRLLRAYQEAGALDATARTVEAITTLPPDDTGLDGLVRQELGRLDEPARELLGALAVWGTRAVPADLARLVYSSADAAAAPLGRASASGLLREEREGTADFAHALFRDVVYADLPPVRRRSLHRRAAETLERAGALPSVIAEHVLRATEGRAPSEDGLLEWARALFLSGRGAAAETLIQRSAPTLRDPRIAAGLHNLLIRSLANRGRIEEALAAIDGALGIADLPAPAARTLRVTRRWLLVLTGQPWTQDDEALLARAAAAGDRRAHAGLLAVLAAAANLGGDVGRARELLRQGEELLGADDIGVGSAFLVLPPLLALAEGGPAAAREAVTAVRRRAAQNGSAWVDPFLGFTAGGAAFLAGDWDDAVAELDAALERAEETETGWISTAVGMRSYIDAHRGQTAAARTRLESFRHRGLPLQFGHDNPGLAELAVLEAERITREAATLAGTLWRTARTRPTRWPAELLPDVLRTAISGLDRELVEQIRVDAATTSFAVPGIRELAHGVIVSDPEEIDAAVGHFTSRGRTVTAAFAAEELACAAAAAKDRARAERALEAALATYRRLGATADHDRALARTRALGLHRGPRARHRVVDSGWAALTESEMRIAGLVREGLTNREIATRLFVSPRTVQTHVSHVLRKTGLRSRVDVARAVAQIGQQADVSTSARS
jgi:DNA-binding CsgD family transcriptional regulator/tetratricopeptide (TPR) repeat protein